MNEARFAGQLCHCCMGTHGPSAAACTPSCAPHVPSLPPSLAGRLRAHAPESGGPQLLGGAHACCTPAARLLHACSRLLTPATERAALALHCLQQQHTDDRAEPPRCNLPSRAVPRSPACHRITQYIACHRSELGSHERGADGGREATEGDAMLRFHLMNFG